MTDQTALHNDLAGKIIASIVKPVLDNGGQMTDVLILLESVVVGVSLVAIKFGGDEKVLDVVMERAKERLAAIRLGDVEPGGTA